MFSKKGVYWINIKVLNLYSNLFNVAQIDEFKLVHERIAPNKILIELLKMNFSLNGCFVLHLSAS